MLRKTLITLRNNWRYMRNPDKWDLDGKRKVGGVKLITCREDELYFEEFYKQACQDLFHDI